MRVASDTQATSDAVALGAVVPIALGAGKGQATSARLVNHVGEELGVPQGQLAAERNALNAVIKVLAPSLCARRRGERTRAVDSEVARAGCSRTRGGRSMDAWWQTRGSSVSACRAVSSGCRFTRPRASWWPQRASLRAYPMSCGSSPTRATSPSVRSDGNRWRAARSTPRLGQRPSETRER